MSFPGRNYFPTKSNSMDFPACQSCNHIVCVCGTENHSLTRRGATENNFMAQTQHQYPTTTYPHYRPQQDGAASSSSVSQTHGPFPYYNGPEQSQLCSHHGGRVVNSAVVSTHVEGPYAYGQKNESEARMAEMLAAFNHSFIQQNAALPVQHEPVVHPQDDLLHDGTIDPAMLSLPLVGERVPCPECGRMLKDEKSVSRHLARQHNPNVQYFECQEEDCFYSTQKKADLRRHARSIHPVVDTDPKPYKCYVCGVGFSRNDNLKRHVQTCLRNLSQQ